MILIIKVSCFQIRRNKTHLHFIDQNIYLNLPLTIKMCIVVITGNFVPTHSLKVIKQFYSTGKYTISSSSFFSLVPTLKWTTWNFPFCRLCYLLDANICILSYPSMPKHLRWAVSDYIILCSLCRWFVIFNVFPCRWNQNTWHT